MTMQHCSKAGTPKILKRCSLPLTGREVVDLIVTELAVFECLTTDGVRELVLIEHAEGVSVEEIAAKTEAAFRVSDNLCIMQQ